MRKDVLKGVGWAMVLSLVAFGAIAVDRMVRSTPTHAAGAAVPVKEQEVLPAPETVAAVAAAVPLPQPVVRSAPGSVKPAVRLDTVPAPPLLPPFTETGDYTRPAPPAVGRLPEFRTALVDSPAPAVVENSDSKRVTNYSESDDKAPPANPAVRAIKSVGRVLGIGRKEKEAPAESSK